MAKTIYTDESSMPFGKHKGTPLIDVPDDYLLWLYENDRMGRIEDYIIDNLDAIRANVPLDQEDSY